jgi:hypothetical protein
MTVSLKHTFQSANPDGPDASQVQPSNWNEEHELTLATNKVLGRATAGTGAAEELSVGTALSISGGTLAVTTVPVANGGTGATTLTGYVKGSGTSAFTAAATVPVGDLTGTLGAANGGTGITSVGASGNILTSNGTAWTSAAPAAPAWVQISSAAFVAGGTTFSSIPTTYSDLLVIVYDVESSGTANISYALGTSTTFSSAITLSNFSNFGYVGIYIPAYKNARGVAITNFTPITTVPTSPTLSDGTPDTTFWVVTGGVAQIRLTGSSVVGGTGTAVLYGK